MSVGVRIGFFIVLLTSANTTFIDGEIMTVINWVTVVEAAAILSVGTDTIKRCIREGLIPEDSVINRGAGHKIFIDPASIEILIKNNLAPRGRKVTKRSKYE